MCTYNPNFLSNETTTVNLEELKTKDGVSKFFSNVTIVIKAKHKYLEAVVNDVGLKLNNSVLELTQKAAKLLDIREGEIVPCKVNVHRVHRSFLNNFLKYCYPFIILYVYVLYT